MVGRPIRPPLSDRLRGQRIVTLHIGALTIHQVHIGHGVIVVIAKLERLAQVVDAFLDIGRILLFQSARTLSCPSKPLPGFRPELGALFHAGLVGLGPVDNGDRVVRLGIVRVELRSLL